MPWILLARKTKAGIASPSAERRVASAPIFLHFYQTGAFRDQPEAQTISFIAATRRYRLMRRCELLPDELDHPRAEEYYYRIDIGPLQRLERPVPATNFSQGDVYPYDDGETAHGH